MKEIDFREKFLDYPYKVESLDVVLKTSRFVNISLVTHGFRLNALPHVLGFDLSEVYITPVSDRSFCDSIVVNLHYVKL